jgi:Arc/MetJ family transcription regulator
MSRITIEIDDELVAEVMRRYNLKTKRAAVDLGLRRLAGPRLTKADIDAAHGIGFEVDLEDLRGDRVTEW